MALPALQHKRLLPVTPAGATIEEVLEAIQTALEAVTYYDGSGRTPGSGSAWTVTPELDTGETIALRCHPPSGGGVDDLAVIVAGRTTGSPTPTMIPSNTFANDDVLIGVLRNVPGSPTYNGWDNASPYTGADFTGYAQLMDVGVTTPVKVYVFESQETLWICISSTAANNPVHVSAMGALWTPPSESGAPESESNGRLYGIATTGNNAMLATSHTTGVNSTNRMFGNFSSSGSAKNLAFVPGGTTVILTVHQEGIAPNTINYVGSGGGSVYGHPLAFERQTGNAFHGVLRNATITGDYQHGRVIQVSSVDVAYVIAPFVTVVSDAFLLKA